MGNEVTIDERINRSFNDGVFAHANGEADINRDHLFWIASNLAGLISETIESVRLGQDNKEVMYLIDALRKIYELARNHKTKLQYGAQ